MSALDYRRGRSGRPWRRFRKTILARDPLCTIRGPRCTSISTTVDHWPIALAQGGPPLDPRNARGACKPCNCAGGTSVAKARQRARNGILRTTRRW